MSADDRLVDGRTIAEVLAEDDRERLEREDAQLDDYVSRFFGGGQPQQPKADEDAGLEAYVRQNFAQIA